MSNHLPYPPVQADYKPDNELEIDINTLVEQYSEKIYRLAYRFVNNEADAEDILQETFIKVLKNIDTFKGDSEIFTWIYRIATNEALMFLRKKKTNKADLLIEQISDDGELEINFIDWCCLPEETFLTGEFSEFLNEEINGLSDPLKEVFVLRDLEQNSIKETADLLNITEAAVKVRLLRARLKLRESITEHFAISSEGFK